MIDVAKIGKTVGVRGDLKLHILSDFPQIFSQEVVFYASRGGLCKECFPLRIKRYKEGLVCFEGYESLESAKTLTNAMLQMTLEDTKRFCVLHEGEFFWFDLLGLEIIEDGERLGVVKEIERIVDVDYLLIEADFKEGFPKRFMLPYVDRYILKTSFEEKRIFTQGAKAIWLAS